MRRAMDDAPTPVPRDMERRMTFDPLIGLVELDAHIAAITDEAAAAHVRVDRHRLRNELQAATFRLRAACAVRLLLSPSGALAIEVSPNP
jgi:para-aminobenzoate synthetase / 4-amino-4-deoxychorismate lyase